MSAEDPPTMKALIGLMSRSDAAGGNPRHCGHSPFGMREFKRVYFGPAYARKMVKTASEQGVTIALNCTVTSLGEAGLLTLSTPQGKTRLQAKRVIISTGIREMPRAPRFVSGQRPMGIMTTGALQSMVYLSHKKPFKRPVIIGSELVSFSAIGSCRHVGIKPVAMIEENQRVTAFSALQILPRILGMDILLGTEILDIEGRQQVTGVNVINAAGKQQHIECDGVIFSGKFTPEASLVRIGHLEIDPRTQGPVVDQFGRCSDPVYFAAGNVLRPVETGGWCWSEGAQTAHFVKDSLVGNLPDTDNQLHIDISGEQVKYIMPQKISLSAGQTTAGMKNLQLRFNHAVKGKLQIHSDSSEVYSTNISALPERRVLVPMSEIIDNKTKKLSVSFY